MSPIGISYDQNSRFSLFPDFCENQICYKRGGFIKQEMESIQIHKTYQKIKFLRYIFDILQPLQKSPKAFILF